MDIPNDSFLIIKDDNFELLTSSIIGSSHINKKQICQDALYASSIFYRGEKITIAIISDGHGAKKYKYSDVGAILATEVTQNTLLNFAKLIVKNRLTEVEANEYFKDKIFKNILTQWHERIEDDYKKSSNENDRIEKFYELYGCTLSFLLICKEKIYAGQIGDGGIYNYYNAVNNDEIKLILPKIESENIGLSTDSLCNYSAIYKYQSTIFKLNRKKGKGILLLSTDGLLDSLENLNEMIKDLYIKICEYGIDNIGKKWPKVLRKWSDEGVGDDISIIIIYYK